MADLDPGKPATKRATPFVTPADHLAYEQGCRYYPRVAERPITFIERFCRQSQGKWASKPLLLLDWQKDFLRRLFGWLKPDMTRRHESAYLEVPKKNGKSTLLSALVLFLLVGDDAGPKIFINACDRDQARIIFDESTAMVKASPELGQRIEPIPSRNRIVYPKGNGYIQANSAEAPSKDGANASAVIFDELHRQKTRELWDMFEYAGAGREQPLKISITTAGEDEAGVWFEQRDYSEKVNRGEIPDITHLGVIYKADESDDIEQPYIWHKANPSLGVTIREDTFARDFAQAKLIPTKFALFKRLRLNIITKTEQRFLSPEDWAACALPTAPPGYAPAWGGLDLSSTTDITAFALVWASESGFIDVFCRFWLPENRVDALSRRDRVPYRTWADQGYLELTPGDVIDYDAVRAEIVRQASIFDLRRLLADPYNATQLGIKLREDDGLPLEFLRQGFLSLSPPTKELERLAISRRLRHGGNPVLRWMAGNAISVSDAAGNLKLDKSKSRQKIDGMAALVNAVAAMSGDPDAGESVYETRGFMFL